MSDFSLFLRMMYLPYKLLWDPHFAVLMAAQKVYEITRQKMTDRRSSMLTLITAKPDS